MEDTLKIKVDFESETAKALLTFITETQEGKYTEKKPILAPITYWRFRIPGQESYDFVNDTRGKIFLFGSFDIAY